MVVPRTGPGDDAASRWPVRVAVAAGAYAAATGVIALAGWALDVPRLTDWKGDGISMFPNTAGCAVMSGLALVLAQRRGTRAAVRALASIVAAVAVLTLVQHLSGVNLGIDTLVLSRPWGQSAAAAPMRMGPPASVAFLLAATALFLMTFGARGQRTTAVLGVVILVLGTLSFTGHLYGASQMYTLPRLTGISLQTAMVVVALGIGIVASAPAHEPTRTLLDRGAAGVLTRQALPIVAVLALILGRLRVHIEQIGLVDSAFGTALRTVVELVMLFAVLWWSAARVRRHEEAQRRSEAVVRLNEAAQARLASIVESSDDAIVSKDLDGIITTWNQGAERLFGYTAAEAVGMSVTMLIPADRQDEEPDILERVRRGERIDHYETIRRRKDGTLVDISLSVSPLFDGRGRVIGASKIARDITERKRVHQQREELLRVTERARLESEAANRAKDDFLAMLGHELRNPLSAVRNAISVAALDERSRDRALAIARRQADQLGRIVDDLLDVARITRGRVPLHRTPVSLNEVLQRTVEGARLLMDERGHSLTLLVPADAIHVDADAARLEQSVSNLLANSAKYTDPGGTVTVTAERDGDDAVVRVRDNGIGIAPDLLPNVFDLFRQGAVSLDRAQGGLGIGLTLVRRIVELHGGAVHAASPGLGGGAEFTIRLPALRDHDAQSLQDSRSATRERRPARVLMVEDNPDAAESLVMILELLGHHVRVVHDGIAALETARANVPDIMLVDIGLPGMDGYEVARALRRDAALKDVVLVALTGYGRPEDRAQALAAGFDHHLVKPVDLDALGDLVARLGAPARAGGAPGRSTTWH